MILYTIGYRGATRARLIEVLHDYGVNLVIDCRESALYTDEFRPAVFGQALSDRSIHYRHHPEWGNPFRPPKYTGPDALERFEFKARTARLGQGAWDWASGRHKRAPICLLCACQDAERCHRGVLARLAVEASGGDLEVRHLSTAQPREVQGGLFGDTAAQSEEEGH